MNNDLPGEAKIILFSCSTKAFDLHTLGMKAKAPSDSWWNKTGWHELRSLEKMFPLNVWNLEKIKGSHYRGTSASSSNIDNCIEFKAVKK